MDRLANMHVFVNVAEAGGFKSTARRLGMSPAAVSRAIAALERELGATLLERTTRRVRLTEAGSDFLPWCRRILDTVEEAEASVSHASREPRGVLALTAPCIFGSLYGAPMVFDFLDQYPDVCARTLFVDRMVDLVAEGFDVGVRIASLPDSSLTAVRVGSVRSVVCASPDYLSRRGVPRSPADLGGHDVIGFSPTRRARAPWGFTKGPQRGKFEMASPRIRLTVDSVETAVAAVLRAQGIARVLSYQVAQEVSDGRLVRILDDYDTSPIPIHVVYPSGRHATAKVRGFVQHATGWLRRVDFST